MVKRWITLLMATMKASARPMEMIERRMPLKYSLLVGRCGGIGLVEQLLDDVGEVLGQCLAHLGAGVFGRNVAAYLRKLVERNAVPVVQVALLTLDKLQFLLGVIDQRAEVAFLGLAEPVPKFRSLSAGSRPRRF